MKTRKGVLGGRIRMSKGVEAWHNMDIWENEWKYNVSGRIKARDKKQSQERGIGKWDAPQVREKHIIY